MLGNNIDAVVCWLAINKLRAVSVPVNTALRGEFLRHQIADAGAALVICEADFLPNALPRYRGRPASRNEARCCTAARQPSTLCGMLPLAPLDGMPQATTIRPS
jgi:crotonobetaine/carnitine-CoA ligase